jgi:hypothetical protein
MSSSVAKGTCLNLLAVICFLPTNLLFYLRPMTNLQWDTCRHRAEAFIMDYLHVRDEKGEAHSFRDRFFGIF